MNVYKSGGAKIEGFHLEGPFINPKRKGAQNADFVFRPDEKFVAEAKKAGIIGISGHKSVGGMCASLYNAMPLFAVERLIEFMIDFANDNTKLSGY